MKFGKYLASRQLELPEYSGHFIDYKALKKLIKKLATPSSPDGITPVTTVSPVEAQNTLKENRASFFFRVERELEKVNSFYLEKRKAEIPTSGTPFLTSTCTKTSKKFIKT